MSKLVLSILLALTVSSPLFAGRIEENVIDCRNTLYFGSAVSTTGVVNVRELWINPVAASSSALKTSGVAGTAFTISTNTLIGLTSTFAGTQFTQPKYPMNLGGCFQIDYDSNYVTGVMQFNGLDARGLSISETIAILSTTMTYTSNAFATITSGLLTITTCAGSRGEASGATGYGDSAKIFPRLGVGTKLGLLMNPVSSTAISASEAETAKPSSYATINLQYGTVLFGTVPNGTNEYELTYKARGAD